MLEAWIFGALVLILLIAFHWFAYRVGEARRRKNARPPGDGSAAVNSYRYLISDDPITPK